MDRLPFFDLLINADPVVKGLMVLLATASIMCWTIALEKVIRILVFRRQVAMLENENAAWLAFARCQDAVETIAYAAPVEQ